MKLLLYRNQFQLSYGLVYYSDGIDYFPFRKAFNYIGKNNVINMVDILILGSGIGSIGMILNELYFNTNRKYHYVDIDKDILNTCEQVLQYLNISNNTFTKGDASQIINIVNIDSKDLICVDIFNEHINPRFLFQEKFITDIYKILKDNGVAVWNIMFQSPNQQIGFEQNITCLFKSWKIIETSKNKIYVTCK